MWDAVVLSRAMKRHRDEIFAGASRPAGQDPHELFRAICAYLTESSGREVRLMLEPFPANTVSGLWLDLGDHEVVVVEKNTLPIHQMVILGHELWHRKERRGDQPDGTAGRRPDSAAGRGSATGGAAGSSGAPNRPPAALRVPRDQWAIGDPVTDVAARTEYSVAEERRAERFGRLLAAKFQPFLLGRRGSAPSDDLLGRVWASLGDR
ncbi:toxin-antitoxin system, toxin component [Streptomyces sp. NPDC006544]|uniref:toxin-antitoxin system, toxin component n=1 Tax=Streptomyces sp. NPDC006544 TaxID=3154583 RepID=UPI0033A7DB8D